MISNTQHTEQVKGVQYSSVLKILLAYDGSEHAQAAVDLLKDIPLSTESQITTIAVMPTQYIGTHERLQAALDYAESQLNTLGFETSSHLKAGTPAASINEMAKEIETNLTVIGAKGLRATFGILLGGVAQQVVEYSCCPVLVVRAPYKGIKRTLLVTDGSTFSHQALEFIAPAGNSEQAHFPLPTDCKLYVMHVLPPPINVDITSRAWAVGPEVIFPIPPDPIDAEKLEKREQDEGQALLRRNADHLRNRGIKAETVLERGDAATEIIEYVKAHDIDLIICGSRGLSEVSGWLLGSVSRKLVHYAGCSVLVVKSKE